MTTSRPHRPGTADTGGRAGAVRPGRATGLLALALAGATSLATVSVVPTATAAPAPQLSRVVVSAVGAGAGAVQAAAAAVTAAGGTVLDRLPLVGGVSAELPLGTVLGPDLTVVADRPIEVAQAAEQTAPATGATVREALGLGAPAGEGAGTTIAVVDTGVADHPDLAGRVTRVDLSGDGPGDGFGHGTFVAGVAAGDGSSSGGRYAGVAPAAHVLDVRVAGDDGSTDLVTVLSGLQAARSHGADVVNLSLSSYSPLPWQVDPLTVALTRMWLDGIVVVVPAGNDGPDARSVTSPGIAPALLTVGALDPAGTADRDDDVVPDFSARGPAPQGVAKPELVAPGRSVVSLRATGSLVDRDHAETGAVDAHYFKGSGTSFSTAAVSGASAALVAQRALSPDQVKALLTETAYRPDGLSDVDAAGAGGVALERALAAPAPTVPTTGPGCSAGRGAACAPHADAMPPGSPVHWDAFVRALAEGDAEAAASSWSKLSPKVQQWVASSWSALPEDLRAALIADWSGRTWAGGSAEDWAMREWAGRTWAASSWSGRTWAASSWSGRTWAGRTWAASSWSGRTWAASSWSGRTWAGRTWADDDWAGRTWAGRTWAGRTWAGEWTGRTWAAAGWGT